MAASHWTFATCLTILALNFVGHHLACAQVAVATEDTVDAQDTSQHVAEEERRQVQVADELLRDLKVSPRFGTVFDQLCFHHIAFGTFDTFIAELRASTEKSPDDGATWMLLGLFEAQRGHEAEALKGLAVAEKLRSDDALASYYLGQTWWRIGEIDEAVQAMERAIERKPAREELLQIFHQLGRGLHQAQRLQQAMDVWQRLEDLFPGDQQVLEQIAKTLADEGAFMQAQQRYERLAAQELESHLKVKFRMAVIELEFASQQREQATADLESLIDELEPEEFHRSFRHRLENLLSQPHTWNQLIACYERWLGKHPDDFDSIVRLTHFLAATVRFAEAEDWMERALEQAPTRVDLRRDFIGQLVEHQQFREASEQYRKLWEVEPRDSNTLLEWGKTVLRDRSLSIKQRQAEARRIWDLMLVENANDAVMTHHVAELCRRAKMNDRALELYKRAIELAPEVARFREDLGKFHHREKRPESALEAWKEIAASPRRNAVTLAQVAEVCSNLGYQAQACEAIAEAIQLEPNAFDLRFRAAEYNQRTRNYEQALACVDAADKLADSDDRRRMVLEKRVELLVASDRLNEVIEAQRLRIGELATPAAWDWLTLARYYLASRHWPEASETISAALAVDPNFAEALQTAVTIAESTGNLGSAASYARRLAEVDLRKQAEYLRYVARLEALLGRGELAVQAAREVVSADPVNWDSYEFLAQMCVQFDRHTEGLTALRQGMRIAPNEPRMTLALATALADNLQTQDAIALHWHALEHLNDVGEMVRVVATLVPLYVVLNQFDQLIERLERDRQRPDKQLSMTLCLAQAYQTAGDFDTARLELETLLSEMPHDVALLRQLVNLCKASMDTEAALAFQRQLVSIEPRFETEFELAAMLQSIGEIEEASEIVFRIANYEEDRIQILQSIDALLTLDEPQFALEIMDSVPRLQGDWEMLYREIVAYKQLNRANEATLRCEMLLAIDLPIDTWGHASVDQAQWLRHDAQELPFAKLASIKSFARHYSPVAALDHVDQILVATAEIYRTSDDSNTQTTFWSPQNYAQARLACLSHLLDIERDSPHALDATSFYKIDETTAGLESDNANVEVGLVEVSALRSALRKSAMHDSAPLKSVYDYLYMTFGQEIQVAIQLARSGGVGERLFLLEQLVNRWTDTESNTTPNIKPLSDRELVFIVETFRTQIFPNGPRPRSTAPEWNVLLPNRRTYAKAIISELKLAGRDSEANQLIDEISVSASTSEDLSIAISRAIARGDFQVAAEYYAKWQARVALDIKVLAEESESQTISIRRASFLSQQIGPICKWMGHVATTEQFEQVFDIAAYVLQVEADALRLTSSNRDPGVTQVPLPNAATQGKLTDVQLFFGDHSNQQFVEMEFPAELVNAASIAVLAELRYVCEWEDRSSAFVDFLLQRVANADESVLLREQALLVMGYALLGRENDSSLAIARNSNDNDFKLQVIYKLIAAARFADAFGLASSMPASDRGLLKAREWIVFDLASRLGHSERVRTATERLLAMPLDGQELQSMQYVLDGLEYANLAKGVSTRLRRDGGNDAQSLSRLMNESLEIGDIDEANSLAFRILRMTHPKYSGGATMNVDSVSRRKALDLLTKNGELDAMIKHTQERIKYFPMSLRPSESLVECYEAVGDFDGLDELVQTLRGRRSTRTLRTKLAELFEKRKRLPEACEVYLDLLREQHHAPLRDGHKVCAVLRRADRIGEFIRCLNAMYDKEISPAYYLVEVTNDLIEHADSSIINELAQLIENTCELFPDRRGVIIDHAIRNRISLDNPLMFRLVQQWLIPPLQQRKDDAWAGVDEWSLLSTIELISSTESRLAELESRVREASDAVPEWQGGKLILATIWANQADNERRSAACELLKMTFTDEKVIASASGRTLSIVAQVLEELAEQAARNGSTDEKAIAELAMTLAERASRMEVGSSHYTSPLPDLLTEYSKQGKKLAAKELLLESLNASYDFRPIDEVVWYGEQLFEMGYPSSAVKLYQHALQHSERLRQTNSQDRFDEHREGEQVQIAMARALGEIQAEDLPEAIDDLLFRDGDGSLRFDQCLTIATYPTYTDTISNGVIEVLRRLCIDDDAATRLDAKFAMLGKEVQHDYPYLLFDAVVDQLRSSDGSAGSDELASLDALVAWVNDHPLASIAKGQTISESQRQEAAAQIVLWQVAEMLSDKTTWETYGLILATRAAEAAARQLDCRALTAVLRAWGEASQDAGRNDNYELWKRMQQLASKRARATPPSLGIPISQSQFELAMTVAEVTAQLGYFDLSSQMLSESLSSPGLTREHIELIKGPIGFSQQPIVYASLNPGRATASPWENAPQAAADANRVVAEWHGSHYDGRQVFAGLFASVFPEGRSEIQFFTDSAGLMTRRPSSLGEKLVDVASQIGESKRVWDEASRRAATERGRIPGVVMLTLIAVDQEQHEFVRYSLRELFDMLKSNPTKANAELAMQAAVAAIVNPQCTDKALTLLGLAFELTREQSSLSR